MKLHIVAACLGAGVLPFAVAQTPASAPARPATDTELTEVTVTGSRVITDGADSPTPLTTVIVEDITATHPTTVFEALLDLPVFAGSAGTNVANPGNAGGNSNQISALDLRGLGAVRSLILWDGHRVGPSQSNGYTNSQTIPQMLLQRVDVVTGGASAVYGSDAIAGVVNYITDTKFTGLKTDFQGGISQKGENPTSNVGVAWGTNLFGGRGHFEVSGNFHYQGGFMHRSDNPRFAPRWTDQGTNCPRENTPAGCVPFFLVADAKISNATFGGKVTSSANQPANPFNNFQFASDGVLTPFNNGSTAGTVSATVQIGGDGAYYTTPSLIARQNLYQLYGRFDFDLTDSLHYYFTATGTQDHTFNWYQNNQTNPLTISTTNAFLPAVVSASMASPTRTTFLLNKIWLGGNSGIPAQSTDNYSRNYILNTGLQGTLGQYKWETSYTHTLADGDSHANTLLSNGNFYAALDAVKDGSGNTVCWVTINDPGRYPGCVPINLFGPTSESKEAIKYVTAKGSTRVRLPMDDIAASIVGAPFSTWAGPVNTALSAEWRKLSYSLFGSFLPATIAPLNCAGLRFNCTQGTTAQYSGAGANRPEVSMSVLEEAVEMDLPLLKDVPLAKDVSLQAAGRHAGYTVHGNPVLNGPEESHKFISNTWKLGLNWHFNDAWTLRATRSRDFRAPTLNDLFAPATIGQTNGFPDILTGVTPFVQTRNGGNPNLGPEIAYTGTLGVVFKPTEKFNVSVDAYRIEIKGAIVSNSGNGTPIQQACYASGGSSPLCGLIVRSNGYVDKNPATNQVLAWLTVNVNAALERTWGGEVEMNYRTQLLDHPLSLRYLMEYQPHVWFYQTGVNPQDFAGVNGGVAGSTQLGAKTRMTLFARYSFNDNFSAAWSTRYRGSLHVSNDPTNLADANTNVPPVAFSSVNLSYRMPSWMGGQADLYLNVQNVLNQAAPITSFAGVASTPGLFGGYALGDDPMGRTVNLGIHYRR